MQDIPYALVKELAHKIKRFGILHPRFAFFLGAGASRQSGIITASEMARFFKEIIVNEYSSEPLVTDEEKEKWLTSQPWYSQAGNEYSKLFERFEPKEIGRQRYIESIIEEQQASFGYVVLANLIASNYINTIITTNFDDLVYSACTSYTGIRPIVYAYGVLASEMRITAQRPKILKLHGDYLYSTLKNTSPETAVQDPNMASQLVQVLSEYGLVVIGYSGEDKSIMDILGRISEKNDLYWCVLRGTEPNKAVRELLLEKSGFLVEIAGFDEMMNEIRQIVGFDVDKMLGSIKERQDNMIENLKYFGSYAIGILSEIVEALQRKLTEEQQQIKQIQALDCFSKALEAQQVEDLTKAEELYRKALELAPNDAVAYNNLGTVLFSDASRSTEAEAAYRKSIELDPSYGDSYYNLGLLLEKDPTRAAEAEAAYRRSIELDPNYAPTHYNLGNVLERDATRSAEAEAAYRRAIEIDPSDTIAYYNLGVLLAKDATRSVEAEAAFRKVVELKSGDAPGYDGLGVFLEKDPARVADAEAAYRKAIELDPNYANAYSNLGMLLAKDMTRSVEAEAALRQAIELKPDDAVGYDSLGLFLEKDPARAAEAEAAYRKAVELDSEYAPAYSNLGSLLAKDPARAGETEATYRKAIELDPGDYASYYNLGSLLEKDVTRAAEAEAAYRKSIELDPKDAAAAYSSLGGLISQNETRTAEAEAAFRETIELAPNDAAGYYNLGLVIGKDLTRATEAEAAFRKSIELEPKDAVAYYNLAVLLSKDETRAAEAEAAYRKSIELDPNDTATYLNLVTLLRSQQRDAEALPFAETLVKLDSQSISALLALASIQKKLASETVANGYLTQARGLLKPDDWYNLACVESVGGNPDAAIKNLQKAVQTDPASLEWAKRDQDLEWIRNDPRFTKIVEPEGQKSTVRKKVAPKKSSKEK